jgi:hypothetical protein
MVNKGWQLRMRRLVERLVCEHRREPLRKITATLVALGFVELGNDHVAVAFSHTMMELYLEIGLDDARRIQNYCIVSFEEKEHPGQQFRW